MNFLFKSSFYDTASNTLNRSALIQPNKKISMTEHQSAFNQQECFIISRSLTLHGYVAPFL